MQRKQARKIKRETRRHLNGAFKVIQFCYTIIIIMDYITELYRVCVHHTYMTKHITKHILKQNFPPTNQTKAIVSPILQ